MKKTEGNAAHMVTGGAGRSSGMLGAGASAGGGSICSLASKNAVSLLKVSITPVPLVKLPTVRHPTQTTVWHHFLRAFLVTVPTSFCQDPLAMLEWHAQGKAEHCVPAEGIIS